MRAMSTETMQNIISYVDQYFCDKHTTPRLVGNAYRVLCINLLGGGIYLYKWVTRFLTRNNELKINLTRQTS